MTMTSAPSPTLALFSFTRDTLPGRIVFREGALNDVRDELERL
ncbi:MAG: hypothetical protein JWR48_3374, partial [Mycobacterium sp.]|nr:hypothetical protein [Mycobacterium sp.]